MTKAAARSRTGSKSTTSRTLRAGVIGLGIGRGHVRGYQSHRGCKVVAISDLNADLLQRTGDELNIPGRYTDALEMLAKENLDVVSVATPNKFHKPLTIAALEQGCHVLCEKPMAMNANEARDMLDAARRADRRLMINFSYRFSGPSQALRRQVDTGVLGDVYFGRTIWLRRRGMPRFGGWFGQKALSGGGPLIDLGVHRLDLALWLMGYPKPRWVLAGQYDHIAVPLAKAEKKLFDVEDFAAALIKFENGATLEVEASWAGHIREKELMETRLLGTKGGLVQRNVNGGYEFDADVFTDRKGKHVDIKPTLPRGKMRGAVYHFVDCIRKDRPHTATGEEGYTVMQLLDAIYLSAKRGEPVRID